MFSHSPRRKLVSACQNGLIFARFSNWGRAMKGQRQLDTKEERLAIADEIREFLNTAGQSRKVLVDQERHKLSESTVNKVFQGVIVKQDSANNKSILGVSPKRSTQNLQLSTSRRPITPSSPQKLTSGPNEELVAMGPSVV